MLLFSWQVASLTHSSFPSCCQQLSPDAAQRWAWSSCWPSGSWCGNCLPVSAANRPLRPTNHRRQKQHPLSCSVSVESTHPDWDSTQGPWGFKDFCYRAAYQVMLPQRPGRLVRAISGSTDKNHLPSAAWHWYSQRPLPTATHRHVCRHSHCLARWLVVNGRNSHRSQDWGHQVGTLFRQMVKV